MSDSLDNPTNRAWAEQVLREGAELRLKLLDACVDATLQLSERVRSSLASGGRVLLFGNGGSAADAQHIAAELVGRFVAERRGLAAIALTTDTSALTAIANDYGFDAVFARQIEALGRPGDVAIGISTSGNSPSVVHGIEAARAAGLFTAALLGGTGGRLRSTCDLPIVVPHPVTARVQECHITLGHMLCELVERAFVK
jgi:D-sedoheptulose 7-phosphate isomerase